MHYEPCGKTLLTVKCNALLRGINNMQAPSFLTALGREAPSHETETCKSGAILNPIFIPHTQTIAGIDAFMSPHLEHS